MTYTVTLGPLEFSPDSSTGYVLTRLLGWDSGAPMRAVVEDRPNSDGAFDVVRDYRGARVITFEGALLGADEDAAAAMFDQFAALQSTGEPVVFSVDRGRGVRSTRVSILDVAEISDVGDSTAAVVNVQLVARDPVKYGPSVTYTTGLPSGGGGLEYPLFDGGSGGALYYGANGNLGRVDIVNAGTADVWPTFTVTGGLTEGFFVQELSSGSRLRYDRVVPAGSSVSLNSRTGEVLVDGVSDGSTYLTVAEWFPVPAGGSITVQFNAINGSTGTPEMTAISSDGFW